MAEYKVLTPHSPGGTEERYGKTYSGESMSRPKFEFDENISEKRCRLSELAGLLVTSFRQWLPCCCLNIMQEK